MSYFAFYNSFSEVAVYEDWCISLYNTIMTALPVCAHAVIDFDHNFKKSKIKNGKDYYPYVYYVGQQRTIFNYKSIFIWLGEGFIHSLMAFFMSLYFLKARPLSWDGPNTDFWAFSVTLFTSIILIATFRIALVH